MRKFNYFEYNERSFESHSIVLSFVQEGSRVLEIGSATGYFSKRLSKKNCEVWGIEIDRQAGQESKKYLHKLFIGDANKLESFSLSKKYFDYILLQDVLEHQAKPEVMLTKLPQYLKNNGKIIISTPNIAHLSVRLRLLIGKFNYEETGIMDKTHTHFFTEQSIRKLLKECNFKILNFSYSSDFGQIPKLGKLLRFIPKIVQNMFTMMLPRLLGVQFIIVATYEK